MIKEYKKLYNIDSNGNTRVWWMDQEDGKTRANSGILGGKIVTSDWKDAVIKNEGRSNETTVEEQAQLQIESLYRSKLERKYSETPETATRRNFLEPQLANKYGPKYLKKKMFWWYHQPKLDGIRALCDGSTVMSRAGKPFLTTDHIAHELEYIASKYNVTFDGELYNHKFKDDFEQIQSYVKKQKLSSIPDHTMEDIKEMVEFHIYDVILHDDEQMPFRERIEFLQTEIFSNPNFIFDKIRLVPTGEIFLDLDDLEAAHENYLEDGYEGIMLRNPNSAYTFGRSDNLLKHKTFIDAEFRILSIVEGTGNWAGKARIAEVQDLETGVISKADIKGSMDKLALILVTKDDYIGKITTVTYQNKTKNGKLRFAKVKAIYDNGRDS